MDLGGLANGSLRNEIRLYSYSAGELTRWTLRIAKIGHFVLHIARLVHIYNTAHALHMRQLHLQFVFTNETEAFFRTAGHRLSPFEWISEINFNARLYYMEWSCFEIVYPNEYSDTLYNIILFGFCVIPCESSV